MSRKLSLQMLADQLGLSKYAVSRALSGKSGVSAATRQRVLELARTQGYQLPPMLQPALQHSTSLPSHAMQSPFMNSSTIPDPLAAPVLLADAYILICIRDTHANNPSYWQRVLNGVLNSCSAQGIRYVIVSPEAELSSSRSSSSSSWSSSATTATGSPQEAIAPHIDWARCQGIVLVGTFSHRIIQLVVRTRLPYVLVDHVDPLVISDKVNNDNIEAGLKITHHLLTLHCKHIIFLNDEAYSSSFADRLTGARLAVSGPNEMNPGNVNLEEWKIAYSQAGWEQSLYERWTAIPPAQRPQAWIGANDDIAIRWMRRLQAEGLTIPEETRIAGIDNVEASVLVSPKLTTVNLCKEELGQRAVEALLRRISRPGAPMESIRLSTGLIPRAST